MGDPGKTLEKKCGAICVMTQTSLPDPESALAKKDDAGTSPGAHGADGADGTDLSAAAASSDAAAVSSSGARRRPGRGWRIALLSVLAIFLVLTLAPDS